MVLGVIQARINSERFFAKIFARFADGSTIIERVVKQILHSKRIEKIVIATDYTSFSFISSFIREKFDGIVEVFAGEDQNVLSRFAKCVNNLKHLSIDQVVRITADNPLTCPYLLDKALDIHEKVDADLTHFLGIPLGSGVEIIKASTLLEINEIVIDEYDREHVTPFIYKNKEIYRVLEPVLDQFNDWQFVRVTVDFPKDLLFVDSILRKLEYKVPIFVDDIIDVVKNISRLQKLKFEK